MLTCELLEQSEEVGRSHITYRLTAMRSKTRIMRERLKDILEIVQTQNPALLDYLHKNLKEPAV